MDSPGEKIREARLRLGLTLEQISLKTRISVKNLQAIETDEPLRIGSAFLYKSFVRQFAEQLHLDFSDLWMAVQTTANTIPDPLMPGQQPHVSPAKLPPLRANRSRKMRWLSPTASLIFTLVACSSLYGVWQNSKPDLVASVKELVRSWTHGFPQQHAKIADVGVRADKPIVQTAQPVQEASAKPGGESAVTTAADEMSASEQAQAGFRVELSALERTWLSMAADGKEIFRGILKASETKVLEGHDNARVRTGNAGGVNIIFNGKPLGALGGRGEVRTLVFTKQGYEIIGPPVHLAMTSFNPSAE
ncbi:MAG: DUF4115 domain-containing protein [Acidobacteriaceae bacterium]|nr:DUF4115 domain-containing protein [Acidobacteriaceae bacterium]MBV9295851.1 DUF4115 domain-containing protein [Acidobacteriaceae bacterium]